MFSGGSVSNALGTLAVMYSCIHTLASQWHEEDDELKCLGSGLITGALFKVRGVKFWCSLLKPVWTQAGFRMDIPWIHCG